MWAALNCKSGYSFLDSLLKPEDVVRLAAEAGCPAVALTDPNLHGAVELQQAADAAGIRSILAAEVRVEGVRWIAYVKNCRGYENLCALLSGGPVDRERARSHAAGLVWKPAEWIPEVRYARYSDAAVFGILQSMRTLTLLERRDPGKRRGAFHFRRPRAGSGQLFAGEEKCAGETLRVAEACGFRLSLGKLNFPGFVPPDGGTPSSFLTKLALAGAAGRYGNPLPSTIRRQIDEELRIISEVGYEEYFLVTWDLLQDCAENGIGWITRGSAADSLVCFCLGISDVCPVRFGLYFRRFLNRERMALNKLPDIDLDFAHDRKDDVIDLVFRKYGDRAAAVGGFSTFQGRSAFSEIAKVLGMPDWQVRQLSKRIPHTPAARVREAVAASLECHALPFEEERAGAALSLAHHLDGMPRHPKMHPCGIVLSRLPVTRLSPVFTGNKGYPTTHFDMDSAEAVGWVKMDILAQGGLAVLRDTLAMLAERGIQPAPEVLRGWNDDAVWDMIASGRARGVHHIESPAMLSLARMAGVRSIDDLIAIVSVIRPGAANSLKKTRFARRAQGLEPVQYAHPSLEPVLRSTYGVVAYEEHILQICETFAGLDPGRADILRRALVKQHAGKVAEIGIEFEIAAREAGRTAEEIRSVWELVTGFHGYAFCRAHSTAYGVEAYEAAVLKCYHPAEFLSAVLTHGKGFYSRLVYSIECRLLGLDFLPPEINRSRDTFFPETGGSIRVPLCQTGGLSKTTLDAWRSGKPFASMADFVARVPASRKEMDALLRAGAFDGFGMSRATQFWEFHRLARHPRHGAQGLLESLEDGPGVHRGAAIEEPSHLERLHDEMEVLGLTVSGHPLDLFPSVHWETYCPVARMGDYLQQRVTTCGMVVESRLHQQVDGQTMKFFSVCDYTGILECEMFAATYKKFGAELIRHPVLEITGTVRPFENRKGFSLEVERVGAPQRRGPESPAQAPGKELSPRLSRAAEVPLPEVRNTG